MGVDSNDETNMRTLAAIAATFGVLAIIAGCQVRVDTAADRAAASNQSSDQGAGSKPEALKPVSTDADADLQFEEQVLGKMRQPVDWVLTEEPLDKFSQRLGKELGVPVVIDKLALDIAGVRPNETITISLEAIRRDAALDFALRSLALDWTIAGNAVVISTPEELERTLATRVYDVSALIGGDGFDGADFDSLIDAIQSTVHTETWAENGGGEAEIRPLWVGKKGVLIISQTRRAHLAIRKLLDDLHGVQAGVAPAAKGAAKDAVLREHAASRTPPKPENAPEQKRSQSAEVDAEGVLLQAEELKDAARRNNEFSFDLFRQVSPTTGANDLLSGYSARELLVLAALGANGKTEAELQKAAYLVGDRMAAANESLALRTDIEGRKSPENVLEVANSLWVDKTLPLKPEYVSLADRSMYASARQVDFADKAAAVKQINDWAAEGTHGLIPEVINESRIKPLTRLMMANAVYFLGKWETPFEPAKTAKADFELADGSKVQVDRMHGTIRCRYATVADAGLKIAELPYRGRTRSLVVLLPSRGKGSLAALKKDLNSANLETWLAAGIRKYIVVELPRFSFGTTNQLNGPLAAMGCRRAFEIGRADFSGISSSPLAINEVFQVAFVEVDESGTKAAAVTGGGFFGAIPKTNELIVDRPFLFLIRDVPTGAILFVGQVADPRSK
jgi:serpin B